MLEGMKHYLTITFVTLFTLNITGCGNDSKDAVVTPVVSSSPTPTPDASPTPTPLSQNDALVGNWIDTSKNTLTFNKDGTAMSNKQALTWSINMENRIVFVASKVEIDQCSYDILSAGGLTKSLVVVLALACEKSGQVNYTQIP